MLSVRHSFSLMLFTALLVAGVSAPAAAGEPPARIGRVSYLDGSVSFRAGSDEDWLAAPLNYPVTTGDDFWTASDARAEVHVGSSAVRLASQTLVDLVEVSDHRTLIRLAQGSLYLRLRPLESGDTYEVDTPQGTLSLGEAGHYRVDVTPDGARSTLTVRDGDAEVITGGGTRVSVRPGQSVALTGPSSATVVSLASVDDWERWCDERDQAEDGSMSLRYLSPVYVGFEALDDFGTWEIDADFGPVWVPTVAASWAPYRMGHWSWEDSWGWTWIDEEPWGFAPFHYGRWTFLRNRWAWVPGEIVAAPVYAPALVAFVGGSGFDLSLSLGAGGAVGWFPLAPGEPYVPAYRVSQTYIRNINVASVKVTEIDVAHLDVAKLRYANRAVPGAVTAVPRPAFLAGAEVSRAAVRVPPSALTRATVIGTTAPFARAERPAVHAAGRAVARPPVGAVSRPVVSRPAQPPAGAVSRAKSPKVSAVPTWNGATDPALRRQWQAEREQALARQAAERVDLERRQQAELSAPPAGVSADDLQQRQLQEREAMARRHQAETDDIDRRYRGRQG